jgi:Flp pilus assembly protein TadG
MALITPILMGLLFGSVELGRYFHNEHLVIKAVRDGARFAARQDFTNFASCAGQPGGAVVDDTRNLVLTGLRSGGSAQLPEWNATTVSVTVSCSTAANGTALSGIYNGRVSGAPIVTVTAVVPYSSLFGSWALGMTTLAATQQAAVTGI